MEGSQEPVAMSAQQRHYAAGTGKFDKYRDLLVGQKGWLFLLAFELYNLLVAGLGSLAGVVLRSLCLPLFCRQFGKGTVVGKDVTLRQPHRVSFGQGVVIDDTVSLDVRSDLESGSQAAGIELGDHVFIGRNSIVTCKGGAIRLGQAVNIGSHCRIGSRTKVEIGDSVLIAAYCYIGCGNHSFEDTATPIIEQKMEECGGVKIGANSWIGTKATILDGVTIGKDAIVGAHSLVRGNVPDGAIVAGTPARVIRMRSR